MGLRQSQPADTLRNKFDHGGRGGFLNRHLRKAGQQSHLLSQTRRRHRLSNSQESPLTGATFPKAEQPPQISELRVMVKQDSWLSREVGQPNEAKKEAKEEAKIESKVIIPRVGKEAYNFQEDEEHKIGIGGFGIVY